jgi:hypothetical protein
MPLSDTSDFSSSDSDFSSSDQEEVLEYIFGFAPNDSLKKAQKKEKKAAKKLKKDFKKRAKLAKKWAESDSSDSSSDMDDIEKDIRKGWKKNFDKHKRHLYIVDQKYTQKQLQDKRDKKERKKAYKKQHKKEKKADKKEDDWANSTTCKLEEQLYGFSPTLTRKMAESRDLRDEPFQHLEGAIPAIHFFPEMHYHQHKHFSSHHSPHGSLRSARPQPAWHERPSRFQGSQFGSVDVAIYDNRESPSVKYQHMDADKSYRSYQVMGNYQLAREGALKEEIKQVKYDLDQLKQATDVEMDGGGRNGLKLEKKYEEDLKRLEEMLAESQASIDKETGQKKSYTLQHGRDTFHKYHGAEHTRGLRELERFYAGRQDNVKLAKARKLQGMDPETLEHALRLGVGISGRSAHSAGEAM